MTILVVIKIFFQYNTKLYIFFDVVTGGKYTVGIYQSHYGKRGRNTEATKWST